MNKRWRVADQCPPDFAATVGASPVLAQLLWNRGLRQPADAVDFFNTSWERGLHDPWLFRQMRPAVERVLSALEKGEHITVHGDYDADGITGSALVIDTLFKLQVTSYKLQASAIDFYIPHRDKEGYGLHNETVKKLKERGTQLIITVDCGIASVEEIALARELGLDVLVIDHHQFGEVLPQAILVHPGLPDEAYPFKKLAAVGVAFKFACALLHEARQRGADLPLGWEKWLLDFVAIATVTDMMPLLGENRVLEKYGLTVLNKTRRPGLLALIESAGLKPGELSTEDVGFALGPRLNAAGRMEHAELALRLLLSASPDEAKSLAADLERCNRDRQEAVRRMMIEAEELLVTRYSLRVTDLPPVIVLWDERWSPSLVGLLAGKFFDRFGRPTVAVGKHEEKWIGSGRSFAGYDITAAVRSAGEGLLTRCGGHIQACGFALSDSSHLPVIADKLATHGSSVLAGDELAPLLEIESELPLHYLGEALAADLAKLEPFGEANRRPLFVARRCPIVAVELVGSTKTHLRLTFVNEQGKRVRGIGFKMGDRLAEAIIGAELDIVYHVQVHEWNGRREIECKLVDFQKSYASDC